MIDQGRSMTSKGFRIIWLWLSGGGCAGCWHGISALWHSKTAGLKWLAILLECRAVSLNLPCQFTDFFIGPFLWNEYEMKWRLSFGTSPRIINQLIKWSPVRIGSGFRYVASEIFKSCTTFSLRLITWSYDSTMSAIAHFEADIPLHMLAHLNVSQSVSPIRMHSQKTVCCTFVKRL